MAVTEGTVQIRLRHAKQHAAQGQGRGVDGCDLQCCGGGVVCMGFWGCRCSNNPVKQAGGPCPGQAGGRVCVRNAIPFLLPQSRHML